MELEGRQADTRVEGSLASPGRRSAAGDGGGGTLALLCVAQLTLLLDFSIVNVALPRIQSGLGFSPSGVQWVLSTYALAFGGLLLFGGRLSDVLGQRRVLLLGLVVFGLASLVGGVAQAPALLVAARAAQGAGAALCAPAILSLITTSFSEGAARNRALGWYSAASAAGFAIGVLLGGVLTQAASWRLVFFVNVPIVAAILFFAQRLVLGAGAGAGADVGRRGGLDLPGALLSTAGCSTLIYGLSIATQHGVARWVWIFSGVVLLGSFVAVEALSPDPLVPLGLLRLRSVSVANVASVLVPGVMGAVTFQLSLFLQQVQGRSALDTGLAFLPLGGIVFVAGPIAAVLSTKLGPGPVFAGGTVVVAGGVLLLSRISPQASYLTILPGLLVAGAGFAAFFATAAMSATAGIASQRQGVASSLLNTSQQIGTALGIAVLMTIANQPAGADTGAVSSGFSHAFRVGAAVVAVTAVLVAVGIPRRRDMPESANSGESRRAL